MTLLIASLLLQVAILPPVTVDCRPVAAFVPVYDVQVQKNRSTTWTITKWFDESGHHHMRIKVCDPNHIPPNGCVSWEMVVK